jgi:hypothetical protein
VFSDAPDPLEWAASIVASSSSNSLAGVGPCSCPAFGPYSEPKNC